MVTHLVSTSSAIQTIYRTMLQSICDKPCTYMHVLQSWAWRVWDTTCAASQGSDGHSRWYLVSSHVFSTSSLRKNDLYQSSLGNWSWNISSTSPLQVLPCNRIYVSLLVLAFKYRISIKSQAEFRIKTLWDIDIVLSTTDFKVNMQLRHVWATS